MNPVSSRRECAPWEIMPKETSLPDTLRDARKIWTLNFYVRGYHTSGFKSHPDTILTLGAKRKVQDKKAGFVDHLPILDDFPLAWKIYA